MHPVRIRRISWTVGLLLLLPSLWLAYLKWEQLKLDRHAARYVQQISNSFPELVIVKHQAFRKENMDFLDLSLLNDSVEVAGRIIKSANQLDTTMHVVWHFAPNRASRESMLMRGELDRLDSIVQVQDSVIRLLHTKLSPDTTATRDTASVE